jgi:micrococcal nuclease
MTWEGGVRVLGVDTPEIRGECPEESDKALAARDFVRELLVGELVLLADVQHDKYGGRVDAVVLLEGLH